MSQTQEEGGGVSLGVVKADFWEDKYLLSERDRFVHLFNSERPPYLVLPPSLACQTVLSTGALQFSKGIPGLGTQALGHPRRARISLSCLISVLPMATQTNVLGSLSCPVLSCPAYGRVIPYSLPRGLLVSLPGITRVVQEPLGMALHGPLVENRSLAKGECTDIGMGGTHEHQPCQGTGGGYPRG